MIAASSRTGGDDAMVTGAGGVTERRMPPSGIVTDAPLLDHHLGFPETVEDLAVQAFGFMQQAHQWLDGAGLAVA